jgi:hypothetical protein
MPTQIQLVDQEKGKSKSRSMEGFDLIALYDVDKSVVRGGDRIVVSKLDHYRQ